MTLPAYARVHEGVVVEHTSDGLVAVEFGEDGRVFPVSAEWLEPVPEPDPGSSGAGHADGEDGEPSEPT